MYLYIIFIPRLFPLYLFYANHDNLYSTGGSDDMKSIEKQSPARIIALGFLAVILTGSFILMLPACVKPGVDLHYVDALFTSTSAVCVTGLIAVDTADTFTAMGQTVVALLIHFCNFIRHI